MIDSSSRLGDALAHRYGIERELGRGGMATVYLARDLKHHRPVAIKVLRPELAMGAGPERFLREIRLMAALQHPHILPLLDSGTLGDGPSACPYYVMPYVEGESLRQRLHRELQLPLDHAVRIARDVASALGYAHDRGVVHRDIKPENILLASGQAMVADFGIAAALSLLGGDRLTETGLVLGTPQYMSPEQAAGDRAVGPGADVYALGCVLYEMLAGEPPFTGPTAAIVLARSMQGPAPRVRTLRASVPEEIEAIIARALAKVPADRFTTGTEFAEALAGATLVPLRPSEASAPGVPPSDRMRPSGGVHPSGGVRRRPAAGAVALLLAGAAAAWLWHRTAVPKVIPSASLIAVLPFAPSGPDSALSRLGRDLVFTLSAGLDGLGGIQVADAHSVLAQARAGPSSVEEAMALARRFGAGGLVHGTLVREGDAVRLDFVLLPTDSAAPPSARVSVDAPFDSVAALTNSAMRALLRQIWARGSPPTPSLDGALRTHSVAALRAFLQGEGEMAGGQWDSAAASYEHAMAADPTFWLAYARYAYARYWTLLETPDSVVEPLMKHRFELSERDRLTTEAIVLMGRDSIGPSLERARQLIEQYPSSWFGWLVYGDELLHNGPLLGRAPAEARSAFRRALELNPDLIPAWEHLMLLALLDGDTAAIQQAMGALTRLDAGPILSADGYGNRMLQFRLLDAITRGDSGHIPSLSDSTAADTAPMSPAGSFYDPFRFGRFAEQMRVSRQALRNGVPPPLQAMHRLLLALSWAGRGAWDSAVVSMDRLAASGLDADAALRSYGLAVVGAWLGAVDPGALAVRRAAAVAAAGAIATGRSEVAWLDGVAAAARRDRPALALARAALRRSGDPDSTELDRSLAAFDAALRGATRDAGLTMARLEWEQAALNDRAFEAHPYAVAVNRMAAARWLSQIGETGEAARLLSWVDSPFFLHPSTVYNIMLTGLVNVERGRIEELSGQSELARKHYEEFLRRYDRPTSAHRELVEETRTALARLRAIE